MAESITKLIKSYATDMGTSFGCRNSSKMFNVGNKIGSFFTDYCQLSEKVFEELNLDTEVEPTNYDLGECWTKETQLPLMVNFYFKFDVIYDPENEHYEKEFIINTVQSLQTVISEKLEIGSKCAELICCVLESDHWGSKDEKTHLRIKFQFPYCRVLESFNKKVLKPAFVIQLRKDKILNCLLDAPIGDYDDVLMSNEPIIPLYGSKYDYSENILRLTSIFGPVTKENPNVMELKDAFIPGNFSFIKSESISSDFLKENDDIDFWKPLFLSIHYWNGITLPKEEEKTEEKKSKNIDLGIDDDNNDRNPRKLASIFVPMLKEEKHTRDDYWLTIGQTLFNIFDGDEAGLELWLAYNTKRPVNQYKGKYYSFRTNYYDERTLAWYAREDNIEEYHNWHSNWCHDALKDALTLVEADAMEAVYRVFWLDYITTGEGKNSWYHYDGNYFKRMKNMIKLRTDVNDILIPIYRGMLADVADKSASSSFNKRVKNGEKFAQKEMDSLRQMIEAFIKKLKKPQFVNSVLQMAEIRFFDEHFDELKDTNANIMGWKNSLTECCDNQIFVRNGKPQDYITMNTGTPLLKLSWDHVYVVKLMDWLVKVFPGDLEYHAVFNFDDPENPKIFDYLYYVLKDFASCLYGKNSEKLFRLWLGGTNASKSVITKLFELVYGYKYCIAAPLSQISRVLKLGGSGPSPDVAQFKGARIAFYKEPDVDDELVCGKIKSESGGDSKFGRGCGNDGGRIEATHKPILVTNVVPDVRNLDEAGKNRFAFILFMSRFCDDAPDDIDMQFKTKRFKNDKFFEANLPDLAVALPWVLIHFFPLYMKEGLIPPKFIHTYTKAHWESVDFYNNFIKQKMIKVDDDEDEEITTADVFPHFQRWFCDSFPGKIKDIPSTIMFKERMCEPHRLGPQNDFCKWKGWKMVKRGEEPKKKYKKGERTVIDEEE